MPEQNPTPAPMWANVPPAVFRCAMGLPEDAMQVHPVGDQGAMTFRYGPDASVILTRQEVTRLRDLLTARLEVVT